MMAQANNTKTASEMSPSEMSPIERTLSLYADTDSATGNWPDKLQRIRAALDACETSIYLGKDDKDPFHDARRWVEDYLHHNRPQGKGLVLFYAPESGRVWNTHLQVPLQNLVIFRPGPFTEPLAEVLKAHPRYAVVLVDNEHGRIIVTQMGQVLSATDVKDWVPGRHKQTEFDARVERHHAAAVQRHLRNVAQTVLTMKREDAFDYLIVGGAAEALPKFNKQLPLEIARLIKGRFTSPMYATDIDLMKAAYTSIGAL